MSRQRCLRPDANTPWPQWVDEALRPPPRVYEHLVLDLFAGCGGLALGFEAAGFMTRGYEVAAHVAATYRANLRGKCLEERLNRDTELPAAPVIIGGPPCQPFSHGGKRRADEDERDGFPAFIAAVERLQPEIAIIENVPGLTTGARKPYFEFNQSRLRRAGYTVDIGHLDAADFGVPQRRRRVFIAAHRGGFAFPKPTFEAAVPTSDAISDLLAAEPAEPRWLSAAMDAYIERYETASQCIRPRDLRLDAPARTLTCRNLGGATGDMMRVVVDDGRRRRLEVREGARLQSFPDWFEFGGSRHQQYVQVGNAVPPLVGLAIAAKVVDYLSEQGLWMQRRRRPDREPASPTASVTSTPEPVAVPA